MKDKIGIVIPAIVDQECAKGVSETMLNNIVKCNKDFSFIFHLNIDNYRREGCKGTVESIIDCYKKLSNETNCRLDISVHHKPLGLTNASKFLFKRFLEFDSNFLAFFDDDCIIVNKIIFSEFSKFIRDDITIHLAFGYDNISCENPFILNDVFFDGNTVKIFKNNKCFCTENGTCFSRNMIEDLLKQCKFDSTINTEDNIGKTKRYRDNPVYTVAFKNGNCMVDNITKGKVMWRLPKKNHFIIDAIRHYRKVGWNK